MFKMINFICMFVLIFYVHSSHGAVMNVWALNNYYKINFNLISLSNLYHCLASSTPGSCLLSLIDGSDKNYTVKQITQEMSETTLSPHYTCSFTADSYVFKVFRPGANDKYKCTRTKLEITSPMKENCSQYDFMIRWENTEEYFKNEHLVNCSIDSKTFAYRNVSVLLASTIESTIDFSYSPTGFINASSLMPNTASTDITENHTSAYGNTQQTSVTKGYVQAQSNVVPIFSGVIAGILLIAILIISYIVFRYIKRTKNINADLKNITYSDSSNHESRDENVDANTDCATYSVISDTNRTTASVNYSTVDEINQRNNLATSITAGTLSASSSDPSENTLEANTERIELLDLSASDHVYSKLNEQKKVINDVYGDIHESVSLNLSNL